MTRTHAHIHVPNVCRATDNPAAFNRTRSLDFGIPGHLISPGCNPEISNNVHGRPRPERERSAGRLPSSGSSNDEISLRCFGLPRGRGIFQFPVAPRSPDARISRVEISDSFPRCPRPRASGRALIKFARVSTIYVTFAPRVNARSRYQSARSRKSSKDTVSAVALGDTKVAHLTARVCAFIVNTFTLIK